MSSASAAVRLAPAVAAAALVLFRCSISVSTEQDESVIFVPSSGIASSGDEYGVVAHDDLSAVIGSVNASGRLRREGVLSLERGTNVQIVGQVERQGVVWYRIVLMEKKGVVTRESPDRVGLFQSAIRQAEFTSPSATASNEWEPARNTITDSHDNTVDVLREPLRVAQRRSRPARFSSAGSSRRRPTPSSRQSATVRAPAKPAPNIGDFLAVLRKSSRSHVNMDSTRLVRSSLARLGTRRPLSPLKETESASPMTLRQRASALMLAATATRIHSI